MKLRKEEIGALGYAVALMEDSYPLGNPKEQEEWAVRCRNASRAFRKILKEQKSTHEFECDCKTCVAERGVFR